MPTLPSRPKISALPSRHVYDVIVLGGQLGGAIAAALLAKRGYRTLLVDHDGLGHGYEHGGYLLPYAPFVASSLKAMPAFDEVLTELGMATQVQRALKPHAPDLQLVMPRARVDLHHEEPRRLAELTREFGEASAKVNTAYKAAAALHEQSDPFFREHPNLPPDGFFQSFSLKRVIARHPGLLAPPEIAGEEEPLKLLSALLPFLSYVNEPKEPLALSRPLSQALLAPMRFPGDREGLRDLLSKKLVDLGGEILGRDGADAAVVEELVFDGGKLVGVKVVSSDNDYRASCVVAATDSHALRRVVPEKKQHHSLKASLDLVATKRFLFAVNWVVPSAVLPRGMGDLVLHDAGDKELGPLLIQTQSARKAGDKAESEKERVVCAGAFVPGTARDLGEDHLKVLGERLSSHLERLMPFVREKAVLISAPYLDAGGVRGSRLLPHPLYEVDTDPFLGVTGLSQRTPVKNLFLASREVLPGLGLEGEILAGLRAARLVQEMLKKKDPLNR
ncbi:MAG: NAD(P)-binding protein [Myxococcaceae bacterium]